MYTFLDFPFSRPGASSSLTIKMDHTQCDRRLQMYQKYMFDPIIERANNEIVEAKSKIAKLEIGLRTMDLHNQVTNLVQKQIPEFLKTNDMSLSNLVEITKVNKKKLVHETNQKSILSFFLFNQKLEVVPKNMLNTI